MFSIFLVNVMLHLLNKNLNKSMHLLIFDQFLQFNFVAVILDHDVFTRNLRLSLYLHLTQYDLQNKNVILDFAETLGNKYEYIAK